MRILYIIMFLLVNVVVPYAQVKKSKPLTEDEWFKKIEKDKKINHCLLKFDDNLKPFIEVKFLNDLPDKKTITTISFDYYYSIGAKYTNSIIIKKNKA